MNIAIISDIHCNKFALASFFDQIEKQEIKAIINLGDTFGYYPWAVETKRIIDNFDGEYFSLKGNHDELLINADCLDNSVSYYDALKYNKTELDKVFPNYVQCFLNMDSQSKFSINSIEFNCYHGTPKDSLNGRFYPDNKEEKDWFPNNKEIILLGHTHYPLERKFKNGGLILNPGSIGQPRDGNVDGSFIIFNSITASYKFLRFSYNIQKVVDELLKMDWDKIAISALQKSKNGMLSV